MKPGHHRPNLILPLLATLVAIGLLIQVQYRNQADNETLVQARQLHRATITASQYPPTDPAETPSVQSLRSSEVIGTTILRDYASTNGTPEDDLASLAQLMDNFRLLVKTAADHPLSANEDWSRALRGLNPSRERFLPDNHLALNSRMQ